MMCPVLVIDDDNSTRELLVSYLELDGVAVVTASNGKEGLERLRESGACLVLLDLMMPVMDGEQFRKAQLSDSTLRRIPTILVTAVHDAIRRAEELGVVALLRKPFDLEDVHRIVEDYCRPFGEQPATRAGLP